MEDLEGATGGRKECLPSSLPPWWKPPSPQSGGGVVRVCCLVWREWKEEGESEVAVEGEGEKGRVEQVATTLGPPR